MFNIPNPNSLSYAYIGELRNTSVMQGTSKMLFSSEKTVGMKGHGGLYIAFRDRGICGSVESVEVYYYTCPLRGGQMQFQATVAPNSSTGVLRISGSCTDNSIPEAGEDNNFLLCYSNGTAIVYGKCHCSSGYQNLSLSSCRGRVSIKNAIQFAYFQARSIIYMTTIMSSGEVIAIVFVFSF